MHCPEASELMSLRLDADLTREQEEAFQEHLAVCEGCRALWQLMQQGDALFAGVAPVAPAPLFTQRVMMRVQRRAAWLRVVRGAMIVFLSLVILAAVVIAPLLVLSTWVAGALGTPALLAALVGVLLRLANIASALLSAAELILRAILFSSGGLYLLGTIIVASVLVYIWARLVSQPAHWLRRTPSSSTGEH
jgi:predicted anti-sigma-YlaC factor YlaD